MIVRVLFLVVLFSISLAGQSAFGRLEEVDPQKAHDPECARVVENYARDQFLNRLKNFFRLSDEALAELVTRSTDGRGAAYLDQSSEPARAGDGLTTYDARVSLSSGEAGGINTNLSLCVEVRGRGASCQVTRSSPRVGFLFSEDMERINRNESVNCYADEDLFDVEQMREDARRFFENLREMQLNPGRRI